MRFISVVSGCTIVFALTALAGCSSKLTNETGPTRLMYTFRMDGTQIDHRKAYDLLYGTDIIKRIPKNLEYGDSGSFAHISPTELSNGGRIKFRSARFVDQPTSEHRWDDFSVECGMQAPLQNFQYVIQERNQLVKVKLGENQGIVLEEFFDNAVVTPPKQAMAYIVCQ